MNGTSNNNATTIRVSRQVLERINDYKLHPNQSAEEIIKLALMGKLQELVEVKKTISTLTKNSGVWIRPTDHLKKAYTTICNSPQEYIKPMMIGGMTI